MAITRPGVNVTEQSEPAGLIRLAFIALFCRNDPGVGFAFPSSSFRTRLLWNMRHALD